MPITERGSKGFQTFLDMLGDTVELKGWSGFRGGLDVKSKAATSTDSLFVPSICEALCLISRELSSLLFP